MFVTTLTFSRTRTSADMSRSVSNDSPMRLQRHHAVYRHNYDTILMSIDILVVQRARL
jgi:hypothetical protein